jgi:hypothetical protein
MLVFDGRQSISASRGLLPTESDVAVRIRCPYFRRWKFSLVYRFNKYWIGFWGFHSVIKVVFETHKRHSHASNRIFRAFVPFPPNRFDLQVRA